MRHPSKSRIAFALCALAALSVGCNESKKFNASDPSVTPGGDGNVNVSTDSRHEAILRKFVMNSATGCALDDDCAKGMFCFHGFCTKECSDTRPCASGTCSENGQCLINANPMSKLRDNLIVSDVISVIPGVEILFPPEEKIFVDDDADFAYVTVTTLGNPGKANYDVFYPLLNENSDMDSCYPQESASAGQFTYTFKIRLDDTKKGSLREVERVVLETSIGSWEIAITPRRPATGYYEGVVMANQFSGVSLPIRMIVKTTPEHISSFDQITGLDLYMPVSGADLFSPEIVEDASQTKWSKLPMEPSTLCMDSDKCWTASYSTNSFDFPQSQLLKKSHQVNRSIRIEIAGYDQNSMMFDGSIRDILAGVYREVGDTSEQWAKATMEGVFIVSRKDSFDEAAYEAANSLMAHAKAQTEDTRPLTQAAEDICSDADVVKLMAKAQNADCASITTLAQYYSSENGRTCLLDAIDSMLNSSEMVSKVIEYLVTKEANDLNTITYGDKTFATLKDFMDDCGLPDGICAEQSDIICGVDLLGRAYLAATDDNDKLHIIEDWHQMMRESYLGSQYSAWQNDVEVRRKWLESAAAPDFLKSSVLEHANTEMLEEWETKVFDAHLKVLAHQFNQTSLEVLTRVNENADIKSSRDRILSEFADGWTGVSDSLALGLRRYDTLYQDTRQRTNKAAQMRPHLFDLYYSGLVETAINRDTGNGSLNATYGKNLYENVARLRSLDQSFDDLVFMRDAQIVTNSSLDPSDGVLSSRKELARRSVAQAQERRDKVFGDYDQSTLNQAEINAMLKSTIESLQSELVNLCGLPRGCQKVNDTNCAPRAIAGFCGFDLPAESETPANLEKQFTNAIDPSEIDSYYNGKKYEYSEDELYAINLTQDDIKNLPEDKRNELLGITDSDLEDLTDEEKTEFLDGKINTFLSTKHLLLTDFYSLTNDGEAAQAILNYRSAIKDVDIARADYIALSNKVAIAEATCDSYETNLTQWHTDRLAVFAKILKNLEAINKHSENLSDAEIEKMEAEIALLEDQYTTQSKYVDDWDTISYKYKNKQKKYSQSILSMTIAGRVAEYAEEFFDRATESASAFWEEPTSASEYTNVSKFGTMKGIITTGGNVLAGICSLGKMATDVAISGVEIAQANGQLDYEYKTQLNELNNDLELQKMELEFQKSLVEFQDYDSEKACIMAFKLKNNIPIKDDLEEDEDKEDEEDEDQYLETDCHSISTCVCPDGVDTYSIYSETDCPAECRLEEKWYAMGADRWAMAEQDAIDALSQINDNLRELEEINDAYNRDLQDLKFKRSEYFQMAQDLLVKREQILQAQIKQYSALKNYYSIVQRATMLQSQYTAAHDRLAVINNLYTTPAKVFAFASDLEVVESKIDLAKERIYDYLAAVEYLAVRPFVDLRRATYLARSTNDLDKLIDNIDTLVNECGGNGANPETIEVSVRELMGITVDFESMPMGERFRNVIAKGNIPVNSLTRYTVDDNVRDLVKKSTDLRTGTFAVKIDEMANLQTTCNAKITSIAIQIVGEDIIKEGVGENIHPTITMFYDGQSQLVSCQYNIDALVSTIGPKTSYGKYSTFVVEPLKISAVAGINTYGSPNSSLAGYPFATSYTVLIDPQMSENKKIDWDKVDDIKLKISYSFEDLYGSSSKCINL